MKKHLSFFAFIFFLVISYSQDYTKGIFIINEGWFGHDNGSVNFFNDQGEFTYNAYKSANENLYTLGTTTQFATIYGDQFYFVSKQEGKGDYSGKKIVISDSKNLLKKAELTLPADGRSFVGVDESKGYIATSNGIYILNLQEMSLGDLIEGSNGSQVGNMIRTSQYVFAVKQNTGIIIIDPSNNSVVKTLSGSYTTIVQSKNGDVWAGAGSKLVKINPVTFTTEEILLSGTSISGSWGAWNAGSLCSSIQNNVLYWTNSGTFGGGSTISKYDIDAKVLNTSFFTLPGQEETYKQIFYGSALRIDPVSNRLIITATESGWGAHYQKNWVHMVSDQGDLVHTFSLTDYYWFPAITVFPDNYSPLINSQLSQTINELKNTIHIDLKNMATDSDNLDAAIVKSVNYITNEQILEASVNKEDELVLTPLKPGNAEIEIVFNSNGKIARHAMIINVPTTLSSEEIQIKKELTIYPNPCTDYFFIDVSKNENLKIFSLNGQQVYEQYLTTGKNMINISHLAQGIYWVKTSNDSYKIIKK